MVATSEFTLREIAETNLTIVMIKKTMGSTMNIDRMKENISIPRLLHLFVAVELCSLDCSINYLEMLPES